MKNLLITITAILLFTGNIFSQGKLLIIGGGSEKDTENSWNHQAYKWAVDNSANKKVAIIAFGTASSWMPDYFVNHCGAASAVNFNISDAATADAQSTYDQLITYDVIFLKGGDQFNYYSTYKNTKTQQAIEEKFAEGGVICGTSAGLAVLSKVIFTARNGSAYSDLCIKNPYHTDIQLANDFFSFFSGALFDSHFTIRSRFGRLLAFMANWKFTQDQAILGIGIDEMTAMTIDENNIGTVYGIGSANLYQAYHSNTFSTHETKLLADSVKVTQLLQGCTINFNTGEIAGLSEERNPQVSGEKGNYIIYASGSDEFEDNQQMLSEFLNESSKEEKILILTGDDMTTGLQYKDELEQTGALHVDIYKYIPLVANSSTLEDKLNKAEKILFVNIPDEDFIQVLKEGSNGPVLKNVIKQNGFVSCFIGDNSRFAGKTIVQNYLVADAAYYGELTCDSGTGLLETTVIIPNTFQSSDVYEATAAAVPYAMVTDTLSYGIWLNQDNYFRYAPGENNKTYLTGYGSSPVMILKNSGTHTGFSQQTAYGDGRSDFPNFAGFEKMNISLIDESTPYKIGDEVVITSSDDIFKEKEADVLVNYSFKELNISWKNKNNYQFNLYDMSGRIIATDQIYRSGTISLDNVNTGIYIVHLQAQDAAISKKIFVY